MTLERLTKGSAFTSFACEVLRVDKSFTRRDFRTKKFTKVKHAVSYAAKYDQATMKFIIKQEFN